MPTLRRAAPLLGALAALVVALAWPLPPEGFEAVGNRRVLDRHGELLAERAIPDRGRERWVELDEVSPAFIAALVAAEDRRFHAHPGVDLLAIARAARANLRAGRVVQGGSTLTQQTARLLFGRPPGFRGKAVEAWRAIRLDLQLSKREILTWYVNRAWFGRGATGVEAAARAWFDESAARLSVAEAAALVALLPAPDRLSPDRDPEEARRRRHRVIDAMVAMGSLEPEAARHDGIAAKVTLEEPERRIDIELGTQLAVAVGTTRVGDPSDSIEHAHLPDRQPRRVRTE